MYAENSTYELHACLQGQWKTLGTFDDANQAVAEAMRLRRSRCYVGIRVTEAFHDAVNKFAARVIYRYTAERDDTQAVMLQTSVTDNPPRPNPKSLTREPPRPATTGTTVNAQGQSLPVRLGIVIVAAILVLMTIGTA